jgi:mannose-1-phosphate guanylyltransferase/mannose-1-phosphate guanylyltransferase/phosphomannomutase
MVMAAGLGTRLRPLTYEIPKPMVPVANRPVIEHILRLLRRHDLGEVIANLHWFPDTIRGPLGDGSNAGVELTYSYEETLLDTAGGVWNVRDYLTQGGGSFLVLAGDALSDVDLRALCDAHADHDGVATMTVKSVPNVSEFGVVVTDADRRVQGFQEKPDPAEALSDLANCMIYAFRPEIFDYFPDPPYVDWAKDIFPLLLDHDVPFYTHAVERYWNDVGSLPELLRGNLDCLAGAVDLEPSGELVVGEADPDEPGEHGVAERRVGLPPGTEVDGRVLVGRDVEVGEGVRFDGLVVVGHGARIGDGARIKDSVLLPRAEIPAAGLLAGSIAGSRGALAAS